MLALSGKIAPSTFALRAAIVSFIAATSVLGWASDATIDLPNQYPSPTAAKTSDDAKFDEDYPWWENNLTGDWGGWRSQLASRGIIFDVDYVSVQMENMRGGFDTGYVGSGPLGVAAIVDTEKLLGHPGGTFVIDWQFNRWYSRRYSPGGTFDPTGSYVGIDADFIDADVARLNQIAQLYYQQSWLDDGTWLAFGKMDANVWFASVGAAAAFQNSIATYTSTLNGYITTYPNESTALVGSLGDESVLVGRFGWFDGTTAAVDPATGEIGPDTGPRGPCSFFNNDGHWWLVSEVDATWHLDLTRPGSLGVGAWLQTGRTATHGADVDGVTDVPGWYLQWQQVLWAPSADVADDGGGIACFGQFGWSDPRKNPVHWSLMTGVSATGVIANRPADAVGLMFAHSQFTDNPGVFQSTRRNGQRGPSGGSEQSVESFYLWQLNSWSYFQPGIMWIITPGGGDPAPLDDALLVYGLFGVEF